MFTAHPPRPPRPLRPWVGLVAGIAVLITVAACTTARGEQSEPPVGAAPTVRTDADIVLPLDGVVPTAGQLDMVTRALDVLGDACMRRFGLAWPATAPTAGTLGPRNARRYTILDPAKARTEGYHPVDMINHDRAVVARSAKERMPPVARSVWTGGSSSYGGRQVPAGGCAGEANRRLHGGAEPVDARLPHWLHWQSFGLMRADSRVGESFAQWSMCMADRGYRYPDPIAAFEDPRWQSPSISPEEIATAVADVACKTAGNVGGVMLAVETAYQRRMLKRYRAEIDAAKAYYAAELASARRVLA